MFEKRHNRDENKFYNEMVERLFKNKLHINDNVIYFSKRGNENKQSYLENAINNSILDFESNNNKIIKTKTKIFVQTHIDEVCLQLIDYILWTIQRAFIKQEMRYFDFLSEKISLIWDIYDFENYPKNFYDKKYNKFHIKKISPL
jgi:hypothetical protein